MTKPPLQSALYLDVTESLVHIRRRDNNTCVGDIERALYELLRGLWLTEAR